MHGYVILTAGWILYFSLHSLLASERVKQRFTTRWYRLIYSIIAVTGLLALLAWNGSLPGNYFFKSVGWVRYISLMITTFGVMIVQVSFRQFSLKSFLGFTEEKAGLRTDGILQYVRHPLYSGTILIIIGFFLFIPNVPTLISCICMLLYLPIGIYLEEKKLVKMFGKAYLDYREKVPAILPRWHN